MAKINKVKTYSLKDPKIAAALVFLLVFGIWGVWKLSFSSAATAEAVYVRNYRMAPAIPGLNHVKDPAAYPMDEMVMQLTTGGKLAFSPPRPTFPILKKSCFVMRAANQGQTARVEIVSWDKAKVFTVTDKYRELCIASKDLRDGTGKDYNARHISGGPVNIMYMIAHISPSQEPNTTDNSDPTKWNYITLVSDLSGGTVHACRDSQTVHTKVVSRDGNNFSWWFDASPAQSREIKIGGTSYHSFDYAGYKKFHAYVHKSTKGGYSPATLEILNINNCY